MTQLSADGIEPRLSPDGKLISFSAVSKESHDAGLFIMNGDGTGKTDITSKMDTASWHNHNIYPEWSPDGN
ncbi:TolB family protein [Sporosarcina obsidiansis]|uniref:TolB family protein n=1 Tax=Sporosarcina obsidiansis TaxID=2660748 RepID=UPI001891C309|nr:PD40 domain-containing protein [Sporosarcina obsidiansis]